jgi:hypothetical protein
MRTNSAVPAVEQEFANADLGDARSDARLSAIAGKMAAAPSATFPKMTDDRSELEAMYRFLGNHEVAYQDILAPHVAQTVERCRQQGLVLCLHDGTEFKFAGRREGLMDASDSSTFSAHVSFALAPGELRLPLGLLAIQPFLSMGGAKGVLQRGQPKQTKERAYKVRREDKSSYHWDLGIDAAAEVIGDAAEIIHVCDREADDFVLLAKLCGERKRFIIRGDASRPVIGDERTSNQVRAELESSKYELCREVRIATRQKGSKANPRREARNCRLGIRASAVELIAPQKAQTDVKSLRLNAVQVVELEPPAGEATVEWTLYTTESIATPEGIEFIVDAYRSRWVIEEFFKAIKTGCAYETRQLAESHGLLNALAVTLPVAWRLLLIRSLARSPAGAEPARKILPKQHLEVLRALTANRDRPLPENPTIRDAMLSIANLGGHLKNNGEPGWQTLAGGYFKLVNALHTQESLLAAGLITRRRRKQPHVV